MRSTRISATFCLVGLSRRRKSCRSVRGKAQRAGGPGHHRGGRPVECVHHRCVCADSSGPVHAALCADRHGNAGDHESRGHAGLPAAANWATLAEMYERLPDSRFLASRARRTRSTFASPSRAAVRMERPRDAETRRRDDSPAPGQRAQAQQHAHEQHESLIDLVARHAHLERADIRKHTPLTAAAPDLTRARSYCLLFGAASATSVIAGRHRAST